MLLAPSWSGLQKMLHILEDAYTEIEMSFNNKKTVCMIFQPTDRSKCVSVEFPQFSLSGCALSYVSEFKYLGHIIDVSCSDDKDIKREIRNLYTRTNILARRFKRCSAVVKLRLFKTFCMCFYDIVLWNRYTTSMYNNFNACYIKCIKVFFGYHKYYSVTNMLLQLGLPTFDTVLHNQEIRFTHRLECNRSSIVSYYNCLTRMSHSCAV